MVDVFGDIDLFHAQGSVGPRALANGPPHRLESGARPRGRHGHGHQLQNGHPPGSHLGRSGFNPWSLDDPRHNLVLLGKELLLLEGHLGDPSRHCPSCVLKHALSAAGLCEEARKMPGAARWAALWLATEGVVASALRHHPVARSVSAVAAPAGHVLASVRGLRREVIAAILAAADGHVEAAATRGAHAAGCGCKGGCGSHGRAARTAETPRPGSGEAARPSLSSGMAV